MNNIKTFENFNNQDIFAYIRNYDIESIKNYIDSGYDLNIQNNYGYTPLIYATAHNKIKIVELLLSAGADINKQNNSGNTALIWAASRNNNIEIVKLLLNAGADINKQDNDGYTALICAALYNNTETAKLLLNSGADIDKQNNNGNTALIIAAYNNNREMIEFLLDYGADEFILNYDNVSFYDYLNTENQQYFTQNYPTSVYNAIYHKYKKSFTDFVKDYNIKNNK